MTRKRRVGRKGKRQPKRDHVLIVGDAPGGNYREKALRQVRQHLESEPEPDVYHQYIAHDDWCGIWSGRECDCDPDVWLERGEDREP